MLSKITLGGVELPKQTGFPKLKYSPIMLYSQPSVTGRLHNVYQRYFNKQLELNTTLFERVFTFEIVNIDEPTYNQLNAIDGTNCALRFERDTYTEEFRVNLDMNFFKFDDHIWFDCVDITATVTEDVLMSLPVNIFYFAHELIPAPVMPEGCIFYFSTEI